MTTADTRTDGETFLLARIEAMVALCDVETPSHDPHWIVRHGEVVIAAHSPDTMRAIWAVVAAGERRRLAGAIADKHKHDIDEAGFATWAQGREDEVRALAAEDEALLALAARMGGTE